MKKKERKKKKNLHNLDKKKKINKCLKEIINGFEWKKILKFFLSSFEREFNLILYLI